MAFIRVEPVQVQRPDRLVQRSPPRDHLGRRATARSPISTAIREEAAAYPVITGPRTLFEVETPRARLSLTFQHRSRRWTVTGLDDHRPRRHGPRRTERRLDRGTACRAAAACPLDRRPSPRLGRRRVGTGRVRRYRARPGPARPCARSDAS